VVVIEDMIVRRLKEGDEARRWREEGDKEEETSAPIYQASPAESSVFDLVFEVSFTFLMYHDRKTIAAWRGSAIRWRSPLSGPLALTCVGL
jgi:hypothetical protein